MLRKSSKNLYLFFARARIAVLSAFFVAAAASSCAKLDSVEESSIIAKTISPRALLPAYGACSGDSSCVAISGTGWTPNVSGASASNHDTNASASVTTISRSSVPITGLAQGADSSREITVSFDMTQDLGAFGSFTLEASVLNFPKESLDGAAYPLLVYLSDGVNDFINLTRTGSAGSCANSGFYTCPGGACEANPGCTINWPSAYRDRSHWEQHQITDQIFDPSVSFSYPSVNTFPTCNWSGGSAPPSTDSSCAFNSVFFPQGGGAPTPARLRTGTYTAKYVILANSYSHLNGYSADLQVKVIRKTDTQNSVGGAIDVNVILVGTKNVQASHDAKGKANLNALFKSVFDYLNQTNSAVKLGSIHVHEWTCEACGDAYAYIDTLNLPDMFLQSGNVVSPSTQGKAINVFLVSSIQGGPILGMSGAIGGPWSHGTPASGLTFATYDKLKTYNNRCSLSSCPLALQDAAFVTLGITMAHEIGHYLGLNHPSESAGDEHDQVIDTPVCTRKDTSVAKPVITMDSCALDTHILSATGHSCPDVCASYDPAHAVFCATQPECAFNHIMWWSSKNWDESSGTGDGNLFSQDSGIIMNYNPFVL